MLEGIIVKGIGGFYYVQTDEKLYECRARGLFREEKIKPLVGDKVKIRLSGEETGYVEEILPRKSELIRPPVANVDQAIIVMSVKSPDINLWLLDRFLLMSEYQNLDTTIVLSKIDLGSREEIDRIERIYSKEGYSFIEVDNTSNKGVDQVKASLANKITVFAGPSGVGKSTLLNSLDGGLDLETGKVSKKTARGKHTTRHVELMKLGEGTFVLDTPGFSSLNIDFVEDEYELGQYFRGFIDRDRPCKFTGCLHDKEPGCSVKAKVEEGTISRERYKNYLSFLEEIKNIRRY